jgi:hypothetical protein
MNIHIIIASNFFSQSLADLHISDGCKIYYRVRTRNKFLKVVKVLMIFAISWFAKFLPYFNCVLYLPHSFGRFGSIMKFCHYDKIVVIEDGIALMTCQSFQKNYIYNLFEDPKFSSIVACEDHVIDYCYKQNIKIINRSEVTYKMLSSYFGPITSNEDQEPCVLVIDNGRWSHGEIEAIKSRLKKNFNDDSLVILHPSRKKHIQGCVMLSEPAEIAWYVNERNFTKIVTAFSTAAVNIKSIRPNLPVIFVYPDARLYESHIVGFKSEVIDLEAKGGDMIFKPTTP